MITYGWGITNCKTPGEQVKEYLKSSPGAYNGQYKTIGACLKEATKAAENISENLTARPITVNIFTIVR